MIQPVSEETKKKSFLLSALKIYLFYYFLFAICRFVIYDEAILTGNLIVILMAIILTVSSKVYSWLKPRLKIDMNQKKYRYFISPIRTAIGMYITITLIRYAIIQDSIITKSLEIIMFCIFIGIFDGVGAKIDDVSPRDPKKEPYRPLRYYIKKYIIHATPFHKLMFFVYGFCAFLLILVFLIFLM